MSSLSLIDELIGALKEKYDKERKGCHISDICLCPRESVFRRLNPSALSTMDFMFFIMGSGQHDVIQSLRHWLGNKRMITEKSISYKSVRGHVDAIIDDVVVEIKTQRTKEHSLKSHYVTQIKSYMAMLNRKFGKVFTISLVNYNTPFKIWDITMTDEEITKQREWIEQEGKQYRKALRMKDWKIARAVKGTELDWKCGYCKFKQPCFEYEESKQYK